MKKALLIITLISISLATTIAQETEQKNKFLQWATAGNPAYMDSTATSVVVKQPENIKISPTLTSGDYLVKASNNMGVGAMFGVLSGVTGIMLSKVNADIAKNNTTSSTQNAGNKEKALKSQKNVLSFLTVGLGVTSFSFICIVMPINLNKAGKAYNQEHKK